MIIAVILLSAVSVGLACVSILCNGNRIGEGDASHLCCLHSSDSVKRPADGDSNDRADSSSSASQSPGAANGTPDDGESSDDGNVSDDGNSGGSQEGGEVSDVIDNIIDEAENNSVHVSPFGFLEVNTAALAQVLLPVGSKSFTLSERGNVMREAKHLEVLQNSYLTPINDLRSSFDSLNSFSVFGVAGSGETVSSFEDLKFLSWMTPMTYSLGSKRYLPLLYAHLPRHTNPDTVVTKGSVHSLAIRDNLVNVLSIYDTGLKSNFHTPSTYYSDPTGEFKKLRTNRDDLPYLYMCAIAAVNKYGVHDHIKNTFRDEPNRDVETIMQWVIMTFLCQHVGLSHHCPFGMIQWLDDMQPEFAISNTFDQLGLSIYDYYSSDDFRLIGYDPSVDEYDVAMEDTIMEWKTLAYLGYVVSKIRSDLYAYIDTSILLFAFSGGTDKSLLDVYNDKRFYYDAWAATSFGYAWAPSINTRNSFNLKWTYSGSDVPVLLEKQLYSAHRASVLAKLKDQFSDKAVHIYLKMLAFSLFSTPGFDDVKTIRIDRDLIAELIERFKKERLPRDYTAVSYNFQLERDIMYNPGLKDASIENYRISSKYRVGPLSCNPQPVFDLHLSPDDGAASAEFTILRMIILSGVFASKARIDSFMELGFESAQFPPDLIFSTFEFAVQGDEYYIHRDAVKRDSVREYDENFLIQSNDEINNNLLKFPNQ